MTHLLKFIYLFLFLMISIGIKSLAQIPSLLYVSTLDTTIKVTDRKPFELLSSQTADSIVWDVYTKQDTPLTFYGASFSSDSLISDGYIFLKKNGKWTYNYFQACGLHQPCAVTNLLLVNGLTVVVSPAYPIDTNSASAFWGVTDGVWNYEPTGYSIVVTSIATVSAFVIYNGLDYIQTVTVNGITYDSLTTGNLNAPIGPNPTTSYQWYRNNILLNNVTSSSFVPQTVGAYTVAINWQTKYFPDSAKFSYTVRNLPTLTGLTENSVNNFQVNIYPNPASDHFFINSLGDFDYVVEDLNGSTLVVGSGNNQASVNLNHWKPGVYFIRVSIAQGSVVKRIVIN